MEPYTKPMIQHDIVQGIIKGEYLQTGLLSERQLMEKYGVSKSIVREALVELCSENVLRSIPRYGYEIVTLTEGEVRDILKFRVLVECNSLPSVLKQARQEELEELADYTHNLSPSGDQDVWDAWDNNSRFHLQLIAMGGNRYVYDQLKRSLSILKRAYAQFYWDQWRRMRFHFDSEPHIQITDLLIRGDLDTARRVLEEDISSFGYKL